MVSGAKYFEGGHPGKAQGERPGSRPRASMFERDNDITGGREMIDAAVNAGKIVEALKETEAESEATRTLGARAVELLHQAGLTRIVSPAAYGGYQLPGPPPAPAAPAVPPRR